MYLKDTHDAGAQARRTHNHCLTLTAAPRNTPRPTWARVPSSPPSMRRGATTRCCRSSSATCFRALATPSQFFQRAPHPSSKFALMQNLPFASSSPDALKLPQVLRWRVVLSTDHGQERWPSLKEVVSSRSELCIRVSLRIDTLRVHLDAM